MDLARPTELHHVTENGDGEGSACSVDQLASSGRGDGRPRKSKKKNGLGDGANRRGTRMTGLQVGVGLLARLEHRETGHPLDN